MAFTAPRLQTRIEPTEYGEMEPTTVQCGRCKQWRIGMSDGLCYDCLMEAESRPMSRRVHMDFEDAKRKKRRRERDGIRPESDGRVHSGAV